MIRSAMLICSQDRTQGLAFWRDAESSAGPALPFGSSELDRQLS